MANTTISQFVPFQPGATDRVRSTYPLFLEFLKAYYEWAEEEGNYVDRLMILKDQRDVDEALEEFVRYFHSEFLPSIPTDVLADKRKLVKHIKSFYRARGSEKSFKLLFRILYDQAVDFYYPKVDVLRLSDGKWTTDTVIRTTTDNNTFLFLARQIKGLTSDALANVENVVQIPFGADVISEIYLSQLVGEFEIGETVEVILPDSTVAHEITYGLATGITITDPGTAYKPDDLISVSGSNASAVFAVDITYGEDMGRVRNAVRANYPQPAAIQLASKASAVNNYYKNMFVQITDGAGAGLVKKIISYNGVNKVAIIEGTWEEIPDISSHYKIPLGKIRSVKVKDFGVDYTSIVPANFEEVGNGNAVGEITFGAVGRYAGRYANSDGFLSWDKRIQDSYFYQDFSYVLKSHIGIDKYRNIVKKLLHPAALALFGNTVINSTQGNRRNHTGVSYVVSTTFSGSILTSGLTVQYSMLENLVDSQKLFDVSGSYPDGYNGTLGTLTTEDELDPLFVDEGVDFYNQLINTSNVPLNHQEQTIVVISKGLSGSTIGSIDLDNPLVTGYRISFDADGGVEFRAQRTNTTSTNDLRVIYGENSNTGDDYIFTALRYSDNTIVGNLNQLTPVIATFGTDIDSTDILDESRGLYIGAGGFFGALGISPIPGEMIPGGSVPGIPEEFPDSELMAGFFDGTIAYVLVYDRFLSDEEIANTYQALKIEMISRGIALAS